ncbi:MAG: large repetitive protein, partial [Frankiaceae bacterium]|nr:large repetitive protein [Frankiaceae bacterium]
MVGVLQRFRRGHARARAFSRCLLPAAGAAFVVALSAQTAHAAGLDVTPTTPAGATTATALTWDITTSDSTPTSCELRRGATVVDPLSDCGPSVSYDVSAEPGGTYTLVVDNDTAAAVAGGATPETASSSIDVAPPAPSPSAPATNPDNDRSPTWALGLPVGATGACSVTDSVGNVVDAADPCADPFTAQLGAAATSGDYTLTVTATAGGLVSAPAQSTYTLDVTGPNAPTVTPPASPDNDRTPTFAVSGVEAGASVGCTATGPSGAVPVSTCTTGSVTLDLTGPGGVDGDFTVSVIATDSLGNAGSAGHAGYTLDITAPTAPTVTAPSSPGTDRTPTFDVDEPDAGVTYTCTVTGPAAVVPVVSCGPTTTLNLAGLPDGTYTLKIVVKDAVGNKVTVTVDYVLDTTAPTTPTVTGSHGPARNRTPAFTVTEPDADATLTCSVTGPSAAAVTACGSSMVLDLSGAADGDYVLSVTATDPLGNASTTTFTYTLDTTAPPAPTVGAIPSTVGTTQVTVAISDSEAGVVLTCVLTDDNGVVVSSGLCPASGVFDTAGHGDGL